MHRSIRLLALGAALAALAGCGSNKAEPDAGVDAGPLAWDRACPGDPSCPDEGDGLLYAGAAKEKITPVLVETEWEDLNGNLRWDVGEPFTDTNGNRKFDALWLAGFDSGRPATTVHDDIWVRALALRHNQTTVVFAYADVIGVFKSEADLVRAALPAELGVDLLLMGATHNHETPDTMGNWGQDDSHSGVSPEFAGLIRAQAVKAITRAVEALEPARMSVAQVKLEDPAGDWHPFAFDSRDPQVVDSTLTALRFDRAGGAAGGTIATFINWAMHVELSGSDNTEITPDYVGTLCRAVETAGAPEDGLPALGGTCVFSVGPIGALIQPGGPTDGVRVLRADGSLVDTRCLERGDRYGELLARSILKALGPTGAVETFSSPELKFRWREVFADVENYTFQTGFLLGIFSRSFERYDPDRPFGADNIPQVRSEVALVELGPVAFAAAPGEPAPELFIGGYDGSHAGGGPVLRPGNDVPPDLSKAPPGPYIADLLLARPGIRYPVGLAVTLDELGYILPAYDFKLDPFDPYFSRAPGHHYEETNSIGPKADEQLLGPLRDLIRTP